MHDVCTCRVRCFMQDAQELFQMVMDIVRQEAVVKLDRNEGGNRANHSTAGLRDLFWVRPRSCFPVSPVTHMSAYHSTPSVSHTTIFHYEILYYSTDGTRFTGRQGSGTYETCALEYAQVYIVLASTFPAMLLLNLRQEANARQAATTC